MVDEDEEEASQPDGPDRDSRAASDLDKTIVAMHSATDHPDAETHEMASKQSRQSPPPRTGSAEPHLFQWKDVLMEFFFPQERSIQQNRPLEVSTACSGSGSPSIGLEASHHS